VRPLPRLSPTAALLLAAPGVILAAWGLLFGAGGLAPGATSLIAAGTTIPAAIALALVALGRWPFARPEPLALAAAGGLAVFAVVAALSAVWSMSPARSVADATLAAAYLGALALGILLGPALRRPGLVIASGLTAVATAASVWALVARSFEVTTGVNLSPRLSGTLTLPNALAILALAGLFGGLALTIHRDARLRALGGGVAGANMLALVLTSSRSGLGLAVLGVIVLLLVLPAAPRMRVIGPITVIPAVALGFRIATWDTFTAFEQSLTPAGWGLVLATAAAIGLGAGIAAALPIAIPVFRPDGRTGRASRRTLAAAGVVVLVLLAALVVRAGGPSGTADAIRAGFSAPVGQSGVRLGLGSNLRDHWWRTAWDGFAASPIHGDGAGTFRLLEQTTSKPAYVTDSAHNTVLEALAGTGLVGGIPFIIGGVALVALAVIGIRRTRPGDEVGAAVALVGGLAFVLQGLVDVDWSLAAQGVVVYAAIGALGPRLAESERIRPAGRAVASALAIGLVAAGLFAVPAWMSARDTARSGELLPTDPVAALEEAMSARRSNPLAVDPLLAEAEAREALGDEPGAQAALLRAIDLEPENYEPWLFYGTYLAFTWDRPVEGRDALERAALLSGDDWSVLTVLDTLPPETGQ
jgi:hypothetical protein